MDDTLELAKRFELHPIYTDKAYVNLQQTLYEVIRILQYNLILVLLCYIHFKVIWCWAKCAKRKMLYIWMIKLNFMWSCGKWMKCVKWQRYEKIVQTEASTDIYGWIFHMTTWKKHMKTLMVRDRWLYFHHIYVNKLNSHETSTSVSPHLQKNYGCLKLFPKLMGNGLFLCNLRPFCNQTRFNPLRIWLIR